MVGGDPDPVGPYTDGLSLMRDLLPLCHTVRTVGFPSYPDHHTVIPDSALDEALLAKQSLILELGLQGFASTQMCFNAKRIEEWLTGQRARGFIGAGSPRRARRGRAGTAAVARHSPRHRLVAALPPQELGRDPANVLARPATTPTS